MQFFVAFADNAAKSAFGFLLTYQGHSVFGLESDIELMVGALIFVSPYFMFSGVAGSVSDRFDRIKIIKVTRISELPISIIACFAIFFDIANLFLICLFFYSAQTAIFATSKLAVMPDITDTSKLIAGNALMQTTTLIGIVIGLVFGGITIGNGYTAVFCFALMTSTILGLLFSKSMQNLQPSAKPYGSKLILNPFKAFTTAITFVFSKKLVAISAICITWFWAVGLIITSILPNFAETTLKVSANTASLMIASFTIGICLGALCVKSIRYSEINAQHVWLAALGMSIFLADLSFSISSFDNTNQIGTLEFLSLLGGLRIILDLVGISFFGGLFVIPLYALFQSLPANADRGKTMSGSITIDAIFGTVMTAMATVAFSIGMDIETLLLIYSGVTALIAGFLLNIRKSLRLGDG